jgi:hypothetical protein
VPCRDETIPPQSLCGVQDKGDLTADFCVEDGRRAWRDNVFVERLWRSVKYEEVYLQTDRHPIPCTSRVCRSRRQPRPRGSTDLGREHCPEKRGHLFPVADHDTIAGIT